MTIAIITEAGVRKVAPMTIAAQQAAASAALSAQVALSIQDGRIYPDYATGNAATTAGQFFIVAISGSLALHVHGTATALVNIAVIDPSTGAILLPNGSAETPAVSFLGDEDTGIYHYATNAIGVATGGVQRLQIDSSGNVLPGAPATQIFGWPSVPWGNSYFSVSPTITSDRHSKKNIRAIDEPALDAWAGVDWVQYDLNSDDSHHAGLVAQQVHEAFAAHDLDAIEMGLVAFFVWEEGKIWMLRYAECQAMEAAYQRREIDRLSARLAAIEAAISEGE